MKDRTMKEEGGRRGREKTRGECLRRRSMMKSVMGWGEGIGECDGVGWGEWGGVRVLGRVLGSVMGWGEGIGECDGVGEGIGECDGVG